MKALDLLATNLNVRNDNPNQELAEVIIRSERRDWINELVENLFNKDKNIQSDCIKVLYEIGDRGAPHLIAPHINEFGKILQSKNNRLIWGAMIALDSITQVNSKGIFDLLSSIVKAIDTGSVITINNGVSILAKLSSFDDYSESTFPLLMEQLKKCPPKQLPMYAEKSMVAINQTNQNSFTELLITLLSELEKDTQKKRLEKVITKVSQKTHKFTPLKSY